MQNSEDFRKEWSGGYHNYCRPVNKMNTNHFKNEKCKWKRQSNKKLRKHLKDMLISELFNQ